MNAKRFKVIFSKRRGALIAVGENASSVTKAPGTSGAPSLVKPSAVNVALQGVAFAVSAIFLAVQTAYAEPTGGEFAAGAGAISQVGHLTTINQNTQHAIVNWQSFSSEAHETIKFVQPNIDSAILNRVVGNLPSNLNGVLEGNGRVYLINQNGIVLGQNGVINVNGGFVGSTRDVTNDAFMAGGALIYKGESIGNIQILGKVKSDQGDIVLIAQKVDVKAGAELVAGEKVQLVAANEVKLTNGKITVKQGLGDKGQITVEGAVKAAQVQLLANNNNLGALAINTTGNIRATGTQTNPDGSVSIIATGEGGNINISGNIRSEKGDGKGGAVSVLADNAIRVSGTINANSTDATKKGGDIYIGRDIHTDKLAKATDVSGATLLSNKGFVETSGDWLNTTKVTVKAKDWLLDPTDINIVRVGTLTPDTDSSLVAGSTTLTFIDTIGRSTSEVLTGTIENAINIGTNVIISTTNTTSGANGSGNITIFDKLDFANNSGQDATLTLLAKNGIEQKAGATIIQTAGANNNKVNVVMTSEGLHMGVLGSSASSRGITLNALINTNGDVTLNGTTNNSGAASASNAIGVDIKSTAAINAKNISITGKSESSFGIQSKGTLTATEKITLDGTSKNWVGVVTNGAVTAGGALTIIGRKTTAAGYQGVNVSSAVKGASVAITGNTIGHYGVAVGPSGSVESTVGDVTIVGTGTGNTSMGAGNQTNGVRLEGVVTAKNKLSITGTVNGAGGYQGVLVYKALKGNSIDIKGTSNAWDAIHFANNGSVTSATTLLIDGDSSAVGKGILFSGTGVFTAQSYLVKAKTAVNNGIYFGGTTTFNSSSTSTDSLIDVTRTTAGGETILNAGTLTINSGTGKAALQTSTDNVGGGIRINGGSTVNTIGDVTIGSKNSSNAYTMHQGTINAQGNLKLLGQVNSATRLNSDPGVNAGVWLQDSGGVVAKIFGTNGANITIDGTNTSRDAGVNLSVNNSANIISTTGTTISGAVGNISITGTSTSGTGIANAAATISNDSVSSTTGNKGNVTLVGKSNGGDHWGITSTGQITAAGLVKMTGTAVGIRAGVSVGAKVEGGSVDIYGSSTKGVGVEIAAIVKSTDTPATSPGVTLTGFGGNGGGDNQGVLVRAAGSVDSASKVSIVGTNAVAVGSSTLMGTLIQGTVKAAGDINLEGYSTNASSPNHGLVINNTVTSTGGNIKATASAANAEKVALSISGAGALIASGSNKNITMVANTMDFSGATAINAGTTGTVNITTKDKATSNAIRIGVEDTSGIPAVAGPWLSLNQTELNKITAAKTVIGDSLNTGGISVDGAVTTATAAGNITLHTGGNITVNKALTIASTKTLTLNGAGASSTISQANTDAGITADKVEFLGNNAKVTLQPTATTSPSANKIGVIAGNVKSFALTNQRDLTVGVVNGTTGLTATDNIELRTTTSTGTALSIEKKIESTAGDVIINATTSDTTNLAPPLAAVKSSAQVKGKDITMNAVALGASGKTLGYYGAGANGVFTASNNLTLKASTQNTGSGFYMFRGALSAGNTLTIEGTSAQGQGVGFDKPLPTLLDPTPPNVSITSFKGISIKGNALSAGQAAINLKDVNLTNNSSGAVTLEAIKGDITTSGTGKLIQNGNGDVKLNTVGDGNIFVPKIINNGTGNVVIAAGSDLDAGNGGGGQVKTVAGNTITQGNSAPGKTYIYSGSATGTGTLSHLDNVNFNELYLDSLSSNGAGGFIEQNAESNVAYTATIGSGAPAQVLFREKISVNLQEKINGATLDKVYGDAETASGQSAALWADMQGEMKDANQTSGVINQLTSTMKDANNNDVKFHVSAATVIDSMTGTIQSDVYSHANYLKANAANANTGYTYNIPLNNDKYTVEFEAGAAGVVKVDVAQKALTGTIGALSSTYGAPLNLAAANATSLTGKLTGDHVDAGTSTVVLDSTNTSTRNTSTSGNLKAGDHTQTLTGLTGADKDNYSHAGVTGEYTVSQKAINTASIGAASNIYGNAVGAGAVNLGGDVETGDLLSAFNTATKVGELFSGSGNLKAGSYNQTVAGGLTSGNTNNDANNYIFSGTNTGEAYEVSRRDITISAAGNTVIFNSQQQSDNVNNPKITGDIVGVVGAGTGTEAGTYQSNLRLSGAVDDSSNYNVTFNQAPLTITALTYVRPPVETTIFSPVTFGLAYAGGATAAGGDGVDIAASCDAWSQRAGAGSVAVMTLLKTSFMGLRNAKTDSMDAMNGGSAAASAVEASASPCGSSSLANKQAGL